MKRVVLPAFDHDQPSARVMGKVRDDFEAWLERASEGRDCDHPRPDNVGGGA